VKHRLLVGQKVVDENYTPIARQYAKYGIPSSLRSSLWRIALSLPPEITKTEISHYNKNLKKDGGSSAEGGGGDGGNCDNNGDDGGSATTPIIEYTVTDELFLMDCEFLANNISYFPFEEVLTGVVMAFSRDSWILHNSTCVTHRPLVHEGHMVPNSGVHPFRGLVNYVSPLSLMYIEEEPIYFMFRTMYARYWCCLNTISSKRGELIHLCRLFEELLWSTHPVMYMHMVANGVKPLDIAFKWIHFAFSDFLDVEQVLLLWDRLVGFDDLELVAVVAVGVMLFRSEMCLNAKNAEEIKRIYETGDRLNVVVLMQTVLFSDVM
jgi:hypothetical protein